MQRLIRWRFLVFANVFVMALLGLALSRETIRSRSIDAEIRELQEEVGALSARNQELATLQSALQTESFIEREARLKLGLKKPGESVVVIQDGDRPGVEATDVDPTDPLDLVIDAQTSTSPVANSTKWWYYFFDKSAFDRLVNL